MGYVAYFCCDRCNDQWKVYYADMASMTLGDACQKCTDDHQTTPISRESILS